jgi:metallo-beta-lactamase family protein
MKITFLGATHEVTGSCTLLEICGRYYMVDCGMEQGTNVFENEPLPVSPSEVEAVFLTHAHIDHSGMLPKLYKDGFKGTIYATEATCDLCDIMLRDSAHIQESETEWKNRKAKRAGGEQIEPVYDLNDAMGTIELLRRCKYDQIIQIGEGVSIRFTDIGHLLGSACIEIWLEENGVHKKIVFSGDVGNTNQPIINDPKTVSETDYLVIESTYGNRIHENTGRNLIKELADVIQRAFDRGGNVVIPSFAVGRTQELLYALREINNSHMVHGCTNIPIYVDSPLAIDATNIFIQCDRSCFDPETLEILNRGENPIWSDGIRLSVTSEDSIAINFDPNPKVIISASGMCDAGRIRHHLKHNLWDGRNIIVFSGYQAMGTLGRQLQEGAKKVKLFGEEIAVRAEIHSLQGISGHADKNGLLAWIHGFEKKPEMIFVNHGDDDSCIDFCKTLTETYDYTADAPYSGTQYDLATGECTIRTLGKRIVPKGTLKARNTYNALVTAAQRLFDIAKAFKGRTNKETEQFTSHINALTDKWKDR